MSGEAITDLIHTIHVRRGEQPPIDSAQLHEWLDQGIDIFDAVTSFIGDTLPAIGAWALLIGIIVVMNAR